MVCTKMSRSVCIFRFVSELHHKMQPFDCIKKSSFYGGCYILVNFDMKEIYNPNESFIFIYRYTQTYLPIFLLDSGQGQGMHQLAEGCQEFIFVEAFLCYFCPFPPSIYFALFEKIRLGEESLSHYSMLDTFSTTPLALIVMLP